MTINQRLKNIRIFYNLSQAEFSEMFNVKQATISQIEGVKIMPSLDIIISILYKFNEINCNWLLTGKGEMFVSVKEKSKSIETPTLNAKDFIEKMEKQLDRQEREINRLLKYIEKLEKKP